MFTGTRYTPEPVYRRLLSPTQQDEVAALYETGETPAALARAFGIKRGAVITLLAHRGLATARRSGCNSRGRTRKPRTGETLASVRETIADLEKQLAELREKENNLRIRFEVDGGVVCAYGLTESPVAATPQQWLFFLNNEGPRKLRDFLSGMNGKAAR